MKTAFRVRRVQPVLLLLLTIVTLSLSDERCEENWGSTVIRHGYGVNEGFQIVTSGLSGDKSTIQNDQDFNILSGGSVGYMELVFLSAFDVKLKSLKFNVIGAREVRIHVHHHGNQSGHDGQLLFKLEGSGNGEYDMASSRLVTPGGEDSQTLAHILGQHNYMLKNVRVTLYDDPSNSRAALGKLDMKLCVRTTDTPRGRVEEINTAPIIREFVDHHGYREMCTPSNQANPIGCYNGGKCDEDDDGSYTCNCPDGFVGRFCESVAETDAAKRVIISRRPISTQYISTVCNGDNLFLQCPADYMLVIEDAFYGRNDSTTCVRDYTDFFKKNQRCETEGVTEVLREKCDGKNRCEMPVSVEFLDPNRVSGCLSYIAKKLAVSYRCQQRTYKLQMCEARGEVMIGCPAGQHIVTKSAFFGRKNTKICPHPTAADFVPCGSFDANSTFEVLCHGAEKCIINPRSSVWGDSCPGVYKYLQLEYMCSGCENVHHNDQECEYWANLGDCNKTAHSDWMQDNCYKACTRCKSSVDMCFDAYPEERCQKWKDNNQCERNPEWMYAYCKKTCSECDRGTDCGNYNDDECDFLYGKEYCSSNTTYMFEKCRGACFECTGDKKGIQFENQHDDDDECDLWAARGECGNNPGFMLTRCLKACSGYTGPVHCVNLIGNNDDCKEWAEKGECEKNPGWMYVQCWKACTKCEDETTPCVNKNGDDAECEFWRGLGQCSKPTNKDFMMDNCYKACTGCQPKEPEDLCKNASPDGECDSWKARGECQNNPVWMKAYCSKSCSNCAPIKNFFGSAELLPGGDALDFTAEKTILMDAPVTFTGRLTHFTAMFMSNTPVSLQIWRYDRNAKKFVRRFSITYVPKSPHTIETIMVDSSLCVNVRKGDKIGFASRLKTAPIASRMLPNDEEMTFWTKNTLNGVDFKEIKRQFTFSISVGYNPREICDNSEKDNIARITNLVYIDMAIGNKHMGNITLGLFGEIAPLTTENLVGLMKGSKAQRNGYTGAIFHRVIHNFMMQGGDYLTSAGYGHSCSIWSKEFDDENFFLNHRCGRVSMANAGPNTNGCQFVIQFAQTAPWLDGKHVVFGVVVDGFDIVRAVENNPTGDGDAPIKTVLMTNSGVITDLGFLPYWDLDSPVGDCEY